MPGQLPIDGLVKRRQFLPPSLGDSAKLVVGYCLEQRLGEQAQALDLLCRHAAILGLVILAHGVDCLLNQRLAGLDHFDKFPFVHTTPY